MKKILYKIINKLGYRIENRGKIIQKEIQYLSKFDIKDNFDIILKARKYIQELDGKFDNLAIVNYNNGFLVSFFNLKIYVESPEEFFILREVFVENDYNFSCDSKSIVIDIGTNIGIASLFFSNLEHVEKIYCFEPIEDTYNQAITNFTLNDKISKVTSVQNIGLGDKTREEFFIFSKYAKGNSGVRGELSPTYLNNTNTVKVPVQINSASEELLRIINENPDRRIIVKMDCEGAEYEIFENLQKSKVINQIDVFMLEWHDKGADTIEKILKSNDFEFFSKGLSPISGLIYAFKK